MTGRQDTIMKRIGRRTLAAGLAAGAAFGSARAQGRSEITF